MNWWQTYEERRYTEERGSAEELEVRRYTEKKGFKRRSEV
jgi:hypothetical protein